MANGLIPTVAPPIQGTWRSNDYVSAVRLVDIVVRFYERDGYYILHGGPTQMLVITNMRDLGYSHHHISQHHILASDSRVAVLRPISNISWLPTSHHFFFLKKAKMIYQGERYILNRSVI